MRSLLFGGLLLLAACSPPSYSQFALDPNSDACEKYAGQSCLDVRLLGDADFDQIDIYLVDIMGRQYMGIVSGPQSLPVAIPIHGFEAKYNIRSTQVTSIKVLGYLNGNVAAMRTIAVSSWAEGAHYKVSVNL
jgi:hypothetical protein